MTSLAEISSTGFRWVLLLLVALVLGYLITLLKVPMIGFLIGLPMALFTLYYILQHPSNGLWITLLAAFFAIGLSRYLPGPLGLSIDILLVLTIVSAIFHMKAKPEANHLKNILFVMTIIWFFYCLLQIINPEARSFVAWFYAVRGVGLYMFLTVPLALLYLGKIEYLNKFILIIFACTVLAIIWGLRQHIFGPDSSEWAWLNSGPKSTHILRGKLRIFSFFSDAGQFGASMGHTVVIAGILFLGPFSIRNRLIFGIIALASLYMLILSGTRGALFVPAFGLLGFIISRKNFKLLLVGLLIMGSTYSFLKYTNIGDNVAEIRRIRSALDPNDASFQVRLANQKKYKEYLKTRPFGGGIGTAGSWGIRFSPGTFLAETPTDSWYVKIWGETGIVGLSLHLTMLISIMFAGIVIIWRLRDEQLKWKIMALHSGYIGIAFASYGNPILGQLPTGIIIYISWAFLFLSTSLDAKLYKVKYESE